jgi:phage I-like protein
LNETPETPPPDPKIAAELAKANETIAKLTARVDASDAEKLAAETVERRDLVVELIKLEVETPATAHEGDPEKRVLCKRLAGEPVSEMRARVEAIRKLRPAAREHEAPETGGDESIAAGVAKLSKTELAACKKRGISPEEFVASKRAAARRVV